MRMSLRSDCKNSDDFVAIKGFSLGIFNKCSILHCVSFILKL